MRLFKRRRRWRNGSATNLAAGGHRRVTSLNSFGSLASLTGATGDCFVDSQENPSSGDFFLIVKVISSLVHELCYISLAECQSQIMCSVSMSPLFFSRQVCADCRSVTFINWWMECKHRIKVGIWMLCRAGGFGEESGVLWVEAFLSGEQLWQQGQAGAAGQPAEVCHSERDRERRVVKPRQFCLQFTCCCVRAVVGR